MSYGAEVTDLLLGDLELGSIDAEVYLAAANDEMDASIGQRYALPISVGGLPTHARKVLKLIHLRLASGRLIMAVAQAGEDNSLHAYGRHLARMAESDLNAIKNGLIKLHGAPLLDLTDSQRGATIINLGGPSGFDAYEAFVHGGDARARWGVR